MLKLASLFLLTVMVFQAAPVLAADRVNIQIMGMEEQPGKLTLSVSAVDQNGKPFPNLEASNFSAWVNDTALIVRDVQTDTARQPASVLLLVDVSGSMAGEPMNQARAAMQQFIEALDPSDQVAVMSFAENVSLLQDFTADRSVLGGAVNQLNPVGNTALYDGVLQAAAKMAEAPAGRKLVVLLSDGEATLGQGNRGASIESARQSGVGVVAVGLGSGIDRQYLNELTSASGGRLIEANAAALRQAYTDLANAIRSQYTLQIDVPRSVDRTAPGNLKVQVIYRADNAAAERHIDALEGAVPPPFRMSVQGITAGEKPSGVLPLAPAVQEGIEVVKLEYFLDDNVIHTSDGAAPQFELDTSMLEAGSHVMKIVATDAAGREGEVQVPFIIEPAAAGGSSLPIVPLLLLAALAAGAYAVYKKYGAEITRRWRDSETVSYESRVSSWTSVRASGPVQRPQEWPERPERSERPAAPVAAADPVRGHLVLMDEEGIRSGELEGIREYDLRSSPLTFGSGPGVDVRVEDAGGLIAAEEARIWVQRGRLVYHKLTTLSAMATEGVTAGWHFLQDGEELNIGPYRLIFQAVLVETVEEEVVVPPDRLPQEHGMALRPTSNVINDRFKGRDLQSWAGAEGPVDWQSEDELPPTQAVPESPPRSSDPATLGPSSSWGGGYQEPPAAQDADEPTFSGWSFSQSTDRVDANPSAADEPSAGSPPLQSSWGSFAAQTPREWQSGDWDSAPPEEDDEEPGRAWGT